MVSSQEYIYQKNIIKKATAQERIKNTLSKKKKIPHSHYKSQWVLMCQMKGNL